MKSMLERTWVSPFVAISFLMVGATGILMLLHVKGHAISNLHEWMGFIFVIGGVLHLILNWKGFLSCFQSKQSLFAIVLVAAFSLLLVIGGMMGEEERPGFGKQGEYFQTHRR